MKLHTNLETKDKLQKIKHVCISLARNLKSSRKSRKIFSIPYSRYCSLNLRTSELQDSNKPILISKERGRIKA